MHMYCHLSLIILLLFVPFLFVIYNRQGIAFLVHVFIIEDLIQLTFFGEPFAYFILYKESSWPETIMFMLQIYYTKVQI